MSLLVFVGPNTTDDVDYRIGQHDRSILFEPDRNSFEELQRRYGDNENVTLVNAGCGAEDCWAEFRHYNNGLSSSFSVVTEEAKELFYFASWVGSKTICKMIHLGKWLAENKIEEITTLVIDAQGFDYTILKTIEPLLKKQGVKKLKTEADDQGFSHYEISNTVAEQTRLLESCGYVLIDRVGTKHVDLTWEPKGNETEITARLERAFSGLYV